jgi:GcrA cell cycle regulator
MQSTNWAPEHCEALRENLAKGMSYSEIAEAINARFSTAYSRNATLGRARRMGLAGTDRPGNWLSITVVFTGEF